MASKKAVDKKGENFVSKRESRASMYILNEIPAEEFLKALKNGKTIGWPKR